MREPIKWNQREEVDWLNYTVQPPLGILVGDYYCAQNEFGNPPGMGGHHGICEVVCENGNILYVEFNEWAMDAYYNQYFSNVEKRRSDYGIWQASKPRQARAGVVLIDGMAFVEAQIMKQQRLNGDFELLTGASGSMRSLIPLAHQLAEQIYTPSSKRFYGIAEDFGYGQTGWLRIIIQDNKIISVRYDEIFADHQADIAYPELKRYYKQSKYASPCYQDPFAPGWDRHCWNASFRALVDALSARVIQTQSLFDIDGLNYTDGINLGPLWNATEQFSEPITNSTPVRYPSYDNYLYLARKLCKVMPEQFMNAGI